ncbi:MAG: FecR domain-containing protein [Verrucomicrobia bacterium]|nr:FecR domain-containing protein [Verrucomicrobiota bacterium]
MKKLAVLPLCLGCAFAATTSHAIDLKQSKLTQVVNDVQIISADSQQQKVAAVNDLFTMPDILRTGASSRAELVAADQTVTRVGANTIFSFDPASRTINLKQGSLLFHSPHGKGGGTIHTGSATASVLGTTIIVTTTPSGGMKVLDLEGQVEVKFLNGLKQNLEPGHMTFILPGGNQLAPIIIFRLDDLTKNSQLVSGFHQTLDSMPLIQQQIDKQLKDIKSGKLNDTGLLVGDDANSKQVKIDLNTWQQAVGQAFKNSGSVAAALSYDATIDQPSLTYSGIPMPPNRIFLDQPIPLPGNTFDFDQLPFMGFAGRNIYFNTIHGAPPLDVNLSAYANYSKFDFVAANNLVLAGSVNFIGLESSESILFSLVAGKQILVAPGATINANVINFDWQSPATLTLDGVSVQNNVGNTSFWLGGDFVMKNGAYMQTAANLSVRAIGNIAINNATLGSDSMFLKSLNGTLGIDSTLASVNSFGSFTAHKTITVNNSILSASTGTGMIGFISDSGSVNITGTSIQAQYLSVNSGDGILLDGTGQVFASTGAGSTANFTAVNLAAFNNLDLSQFKNVNVIANTINLHNVAFDGLVSLKSLLGKWHNGASVFGYVNDLGGNTYHGGAVSAADGFSGTIANTGITISARLFHEG